MFAVGYVGDMVAICLQFGADAYFRDHVRFVPHKGPLLTNGQVVAGQYQNLHLAICFIGLILWTAMAVLAAIGINRLLGAIRDRRRGIKSRIIP